MDNEINEAIVRLNEIIIKDKNVISVMFSPGIKSITVQIYTEKRFREYAKEFDREIDIKVWQYQGKTHRTKQFTIPLGEYRIDYVFPEI